MIPFISERVAMKLLIKICIEVFYDKKYQLRYRIKSIYLKFIFNLNQPIEKVQQVVLFK